MPWEKAPLSRVPLQFRAALNGYVEFGRDPSESVFLVAVLSNQLDGFLAETMPNRNAVARDILACLHEAPSECWGTSDKVQRWIVGGGLRGMRRADVRLQ